MQIYDEDAAKKKEFHVEYTIGRSDNIDDIQLNTLDWKEDSLRVSFITSKSDQEGEITCEVRNLYV